MSSTLGPGYFTRVLRSGRAIVDGLAITFSYLFRPPVTVQYPDRMPEPLNRTLPERYRGFLEVDMSICTGCKACERDCPINCIKIDLEKVGDVRALTRFDIDMGKCMYCNICVESCPVPAKAPGDTEDTKCIRMTREFEAATDFFPSLTFRFVRPGGAVIPYKHKRGEIPATTERGEIARESRARADEYNRLAVAWAREDAEAARRNSEEVLLAPETIALRTAELSPKVAACGDDATKLRDLIFVEALAQTDCQACGYATCRDYAAGMLAGDEDRSKCEPGARRTARDADLIFQIRRGTATPSPATAETTVNA